MKCQHLLLCVFLTGYQVITTPLPSGGPVLVSMLNILEGFNFTNKDQGKSRSYHYIIEVRKTSTYRVQTLKPFTFISFPRSEIVRKKSQK